MASKQPIAFGFASGKATTTDAKKTIPPKNAPKGTRAESSETKTGTAKNKSAETPGTTVPRPVAAKCPTSRPQIVVQGMNADEAVPAKKPEAIVRRPEAKQRAASGSESGSGSESESASGSESESSAASTSSYGSDEDEEDDGSRRPSKSAASKKSRSAPKRPPANKKKRTQVEEKVPVAKAASSTAKKPRKPASSEAKPKSVAKAKKAPSGTDGNKKRKVVAKSTKTGAPPAKKKASLRKPVEEEVAERAKKLRAKLAPDVVAALNKIQKDLLDVYCVAIDARKERGGNLFGALRDFLKGWFYKIDDLFLVGCVALDELVPSFQGKWLLRVIDSMLYRTCVLCEQQMAIVTALDPALHGLQYLLLCGECAAKHALPERTLRARKELSGRDVATFKDVPFYYDKQHGQEKVTKYTFDFLVYEALRIPLPVPDAEGRDGGAEDAGVSECDGAPGEDAPAQPQSRLMLPPAPSRDALRAHHAEMDDEELKRKMTPSAKKRYEAATIEKRPIAEREVLEALSESERELLHAAVETLGDAARAKFTEYVEAYAFFLASVYSRRSPMYATLIDKCRSIALRFGGFVEVIRRSEVNFSELIFSDGIKGTSSVKTRICKETAAFVLGQGKTPFRPASVEDAAAEYKKIAEPLLGKLRCVGDNIGPLVLAMAEAQQLGIVPKTLLRMFCNAEAMKSLHEIFNSIAVQPGAYEQYVTALNAEIKEATEQMAEKAEGQKEEDEEEGGEAPVDDEEERKQKGPEVAQQGGNEEGEQKEEHREGEESSESESEASAGEQGDPEAEDANEGEGEPSGGPNKVVQENARTAAPSQPPVADTHVEVAPKGTPEIVAEAKAAEPVLSTPVEPVAEVFVETVATQSGDTAGSRVHIAIRDPPLSANTVAACVKAEQETTGAGEPVDQTLETGEGAEGNSESESESGSESSQSYASSDEETVV